MESQECSLMMAIFPPLPFIKRKPKKRNCCSLPWRIAMSLARFLVLSRSCVVAGTQDTMPTHCLQPVLVLRSDESSLDNGEVLCAVTRIEGLSQYRQCLQYLLDVSRRQVVI